ncbi:TadE/TadG family type IV pilus assembly protein [Gordonibacter sp. 28C]|uniref:TadE/TadG family type IV pilus assembly protein n=1 Tax=Gordonibacter sp. 28C TaxID=2078569 RepID=UPI001F54315A|nr:TadE family protein [Gordonibacter sp. 28C]
MVGRMPKGFRALSVGGGERGQATVEAAVLIPVLFVALLLLLQPGILLYDRMVMQGAAAEGCRLLATKTEALGDMDGSCEAFVRHRLGAVPPLDCFHVHRGGCSWDIELVGDEGSQTVSVTVGTDVRPLPLLDAGAALLGMTDAAGNLHVEATTSTPTQPAWVDGTETGRDPARWIGAWLR